MVRLVRQRARGDCGTAALATLLSETIAYEDVYVAAAAVERLQRGRAGVRNRELVAMARKLGLTLHPARVFDLDVVAGVLRVRSAAHHREGHFVAVRYGLIWDPLDGFAAPWREYAARHRARFGTLLRA